MPSEFEINPAVSGASPFMMGIHHAYAQTDGSYMWPNSREGDLLREAKKEIEALQRRLIAAASSSSRAIGSIEVTDQMAYAFNRAISDGAMSNEEVKDVKRGLRAVFDALEMTADFALGDELYKRPQPSQPQKALAWRYVSKQGFKSAWHDYDAEKLAGYLRSIEEQGATIEYAYESAQPFGWLALTESDIDYANDHSHGNTEWMKQKSFARTIDRMLHERNSGALKKPWVSLSEDEVHTVFSTCHKGLVYPQDNVHGPRAMRRTEARALESMIREKNSPSEAGVGTIGHVGASGPSLTQALKNALSEPMGRSDAAPQAEQQQESAACDCGLQADECDGKVATFHPFQVGANCSTRPCERRWAVIPTTPQALTTEEPAAEQYGSTDLPYEILVPSLQDGDKRLVKMIIDALGNDHPAYNDLMALILRADKAYGAANSEAEKAMQIMAWLDSCEWELSRIPPGSGLTDEANRRHAWSARRIAAPYEDKKGNRVWFGSSAYDAIAKGVDAFQKAKP